VIHPDAELRFINPVIGYGVVAVRPIPKGSITWVRDALDRAFKPAEFKAMAPFYQEVLHKYCFRDGRGDYVLCWDLARYFNHSCEANCLSAGFDFEVAIRDIAVGEELTDDYGTLNPETLFPCSCGSPRCRKNVLPDDLPRFAETWDGLVRPAFKLLKTVEQPLWHLVPEREKAAVDRALADPTKIPSCISHYYPGVGTNGAVRGTT
jgi:hypothetical protein